jgi:hypothetical protein
VSLRQVGRWADLAPSEETIQPDPVWPDFFIVGAQNSATSTLYAFLRQHPNIFMPALKEPHYFSNLPSVWGMQYPITHIRREDSYLRLFSAVGQTKCKGEASSSYLWSEEAPSGIYRANPSARIVIILRNPVERAYSHYLMDIREGRQKLPFMDALQADWSRRDKGYGVSRLYVELGLYHRQVKRYISTFGHKQVVIVLFRQLLAALKGRGEGLAELASLLRVDPAPFMTLAAVPPENSFGVARNEWVRRLAGSKLARRIAQTLVPKSLGSTFAIRRYFFEPFLIKQTVRPNMDPAAKKWLRTIYREDIVALEHLLAKPLPELHH